MIALTVREVDWSGSSPVQLGIDSVLQIECPCSERQEMTWNESTTAKHETRIANGQVECLDDF